MPVRSTRRAVSALGLVLLLTSPACDAPSPPVGRFADRSSAVERIEDLTYGEAVDEHGELEELQLTMFRPTAHEGPRPAIVFIHSGAFTGGLRSEQDEMATAFAERGYVTVTISYRLREGEWIWFDSPSDVVTGAARDARHDAQAAIRWLRANAGEYDIDAGHIGAVGYSAGGITAIGLAQHADDPGDSGNPEQSSKVCIAVSLSGIAVEGDVESDDAPVLMFHGADDWLVPTRFARETAWKAAVNKKLVDYVEYPRIGHGLFFQSQKELTPKLVKALRDHLVKDPPCV